MHVYTVHEPSLAPHAAEARAEGLVFVREGFSLAAAVLGPIWLAAQRLWLPLAAYVVGVIAIAGLVSVIPGGKAALPALVVLAGLLIGLEAPVLRAAGLERRDYRMIGTAAGASLEDCEQRFLAGWLPVQRHAAATPAPISQAGI